MSIRLILAYSARMAQFVAALKSHPNIAGLPVYLLDVTQPNPDIDAQKTELLNYKGSPYIFIIILSPEDSNAERAAQLNIHRQTLASASLVGTVSLAVDNADIPEQLRPFGTLLGHQENAAQLANELAEKIHGFRTLYDRNLTPRQMAIRTEAQKYVEPILLDLSIREHKDRRRANGCYLFAALCLVAATLFAISSHNQLAITSNTIHDNTRAMQLSPLLTNQNSSPFSGSNHFVSNGWYFILFGAFKSLMVVAILFTIGRTAVTLGRSFMSEVIKNSDRAHAIKFGRFFLSAYPDTPPDQVKDIFQSWNIAPDSAFTASDTKHPAQEISKQIVDAIKDFKSSSPA